MKQLDLQKSVETFAIFDVALLFLALIGLVLLVIGFILNIAWIVIAMIICEFILIYAIFIEPNRISVTTYRHAIGEATDAWIKIVFIADPHAGPIKSQAWYDKLSANLNIISPDLLLIGGDMVVHHAEHIGKLKSLADIQTIYGKFFILGNHDYQDDPARITAEMQKMGFHHLGNTNLSLRIQGKELRISGCDDCFYGKNHPINRIDHKAPHITLAHEPDALADISEGDTDLVLCGHAHGGQIRFPIIGSLHVPSNFGRKADMGKKIIKGIPTIITRGLGEVGIRARLLAPPEIVIIELGI
ncbi:MAG: metallophosphoesterase [Patescibacteria group bacterium]